MSEEQSPETIDAPEELEALIESADVARLERYITEVPSGELARAVAHLDAELQTRLLTTLSPEQAAYLMEQLSHPQAAGLIEDLPVEHAAAIIDELPSDEQADVLGELDEEDAQAIIEQMAPSEAVDARLLTGYEPDTAGGLMVTEYLSFPETMTVGDVLQNVRTNVEQYHEYDVQYLYVVNGEGRLRGVVRLRDLVLAPGATPIRQIMIRQPYGVTVDDDLDWLEEFFDAHHFHAAPVCDREGKLVGLVRRASVEEALGDRADIALLRFGGIVTGEELRTMPTVPRAMRRLTFLLPNILLSFISVSIIAVYEPLIERVATLAVFLPLVANLSGAAGNQAVAVSIRELALGLLEPRDWLRVWGKEMGIGMLNGLVIGLILGVMTVTVRPDMVPLAVVIGMAYALNSILAVVFGGSIPLVLRAIKVDPAMASSPILTTFTDMGAFFLTLSFAAVAYRGMV